MKREYCLVVLLSLLAFVRADIDVYNDLYFGVGVGVIAVAIAIIVGIVLCFLRNCTSIPEYAPSSHQNRLFCFIGFVIPVIVFLIVYFAPKGETSESDQQGDYYMLLMGIYLAIMLVFLLVAIFAYCYTFYGVRVFSTRVESAGKRGPPKPDSGDKAKKEEKKKEEKKVDGAAANPSSGTERKLVTEEKKMDGENTALKQGA